MILQTNLNLNRNFMEISRTDFLPLRFFSYDFDRPSQLRFLLDLRNEEIGGWVSSRGLRKLMRTLDS